MLLLMLTVHMFHVVLLSVINIHMPAGNCSMLFVVDGICYGISAGPVMVELVVDKCVGWSGGVGNSHAGYLSSRQLVIMEILPHTQESGER